MINKFSTEINRYQRAWRHQNHLFIARLDEYWSQTVYISNLSCALFHSNGRVVAWCILRTPHSFVITDQIMAFTTLARICTCCVMLSMYLLVSNSGRKTTSIIAKEPASSQSWFYTRLLLSTWLRSISDCKSPIPYHRFMGFFSVCVCE